METTNLLKIYKASAGSGKTFRLAVEFISLLVNNPDEYKNILAVTFTNKATVEMKQRILGQLYGISHGHTSSNDYINEIIKGYFLEKGETITTDHIRTQCQKALSYIIHDYKNFNIVTIDSFFLSIVRNLANELNLTSNINVEMNLEKTLSDAVKEVIDNVSLDSHEYRSITHYIETRFIESKSWKLENNIKSFGQNIFKENFLINGQKLHDAISAPDKINIYKEELEKSMSAHIHVINDSIKSCALETLTCILSKPFVKYLTKTGIKQFNIEVTDWINKDKITPTQESLCKNPNEWLIKKGSNDRNAVDFIESVCIPALLFIIKKQNERLELKINTNATIKYLFNLDFIESIDTEIKRTNKNTNKFLISETAHFLRDVINGSNIPFIYEKTGTQIHNIMIDEFQDTSSLQWENFTPLLENCIDQGNSCLIVGDVKQSIYRFRNADWQILNNIDTSENQFSQYINNIEHFTNHRSAPNIIRFNNYFFKHASGVLNVEYKRIFNEECTPLVTAYQTKLLFQDPKDQDKNYGFVKIETVSKDSNSDIDNEDIGETSVDDNNLMNASIMNNINMLLEQQVCPNDIAILVKKNEQSAEFCKYFETHKNDVSLKIVSDDAFKLESSTAISIIISALRTLTAKDDCLELLNLAQQYQTYVLGNLVHENSSLMFDTREELLEKYLPSKFKKAIDKLRNKPINEVVEFIFDMFNLSVISGQDDYIFTFNDIIRSYLKENISNIDSFLKQWDETLFKKTIPNSNVDGIRILTIHKSKGLEFHSVIIPYENKGVSPKDNTILWCTTELYPFSGMPILPIDYGSAMKSTIYNEFSQKEYLLNLVDNINVMYVAFTRPVSNLVILNQQPKNNKFCTHDIIDLSKNLIENDSEFDKYNLQINQTDNTFSIGTIVPSRITKNTQINSKEKEHNPFTLQYKETKLKFHTYGNLSEFRQSNDSDLYFNEILNQSTNRKSKFQTDSDRLKLISLGNLYHNTLELINKTEDIHHAVLTMQQRGCFPQLKDRDEFEINISKIINTVNNMYPEWFSGEYETLNERTILFKDEKTGEMVNRRPDRILAKGNHAIIIDYKTSHSESFATEKAIPSHVKQVTDYCELLKKLGYEKIEGYIWYILEDYIYKI